MSSQTSKNTQHSLYVGNLHPDIDERMLFELFNESPQIISIYVCRDHEQKSLGYAYVNFVNHESAKAVLDTYNHTVIEGREIRIMFSQSDPTIRKSGIGNIFVRNLPKDMGAKDLEDLFSGFGNILSCHVSTSNVKGEIVSNGYGFVHFEDPEAAERAINEINGKFIGDHQIQVTHYKTRAERPQKSKEETFTNVYIKNLPLTMDNDGLKKLFEQFGAVQNAAIQYNEEGKSKGFGFVNFYNHDDAVKAINELNGKNAGDEQDKEKCYVVTRFQTKAERAEQLKREHMERAAQKQETNLYVRHFPDDFDEAKLRDLFKEFGEITSVRIMRDAKKKHVSRGFGFVCFARSEDASQAIQKMHGVMLPNNKPLFVALHQPKQERRNQIEKFKRESMMLPPMPYPPIPHPMTYPLYPPQMVWGQQLGTPMLSEEDKKQHYGNQLYSLVHNIDPENAGKIVGMFLELDEPEISELLQNEAKLLERVNEARHVLQNA